MLSMVVAGASPTNFSHELASEALECAGWLTNTRGVFRDSHTRQARTGGFTSQFCQDRALFESVFARILGRQRGLYVDVAANHYKRISNTYFFDRCLGWRGICVEPNPLYHNGLRTRRTCELIPSCVANSTDDEVEMVLPQDEWLGGLGGVGGGRLAEYRVDVRKRTVLRRRMRCVRLGDELLVRGITHVDFLSVDVEGGEDGVLRGIDLARVRVDYVLCEANCGAVLRAHGYEPAKLPGFCGGPDLLWQRPGTARVADAVTVRAPTARAHRAKGR